MSLDSSISAFDDGERVGGRADLMPAALFPGEGLTLKGASGFERGRACSGSVFDESSAS